MLDQRPLQRQGKTSAPALDGAILKGGDAPGDELPTDAAAIVCDNVSKGFDGVPVLLGITISCRPGSVNVLAGENGAGKSTLFKIISGQIAPDGGSLSIFGQRVRRFTPRHSQQLGVSIIPQELASLPDMAVWENLFIGRELCAGPGMLRRQEMIRQAGRLLADFGVDVDPNAPMRSLNIAEAQMIEIIKATTRDARIVLMDEPSSSLSRTETERLFQVIRQLRAKGVCVLYVSHRLEEIEAIADTVSILRDGRLVRSAPAAEMTERQIITEMVGRDLQAFFPNRPALTSGATVLDVEGLRLDEAGPSVSFSVRRGEILGLGGLVGAGRSEMLEALFGIRRANGRVLLDGQPLCLGRPSESIRRGVAFVPEDRKRAGVLTSMSVLDNTTLPQLFHMTRIGGVVLNDLRERRALDILGRMLVRYSGLGQKVANLSGGNQQKVALSRWFAACEPRLLLLDEPTRGIDVGARSEIYQFIDELAARGLAIVLASSDMLELINLSHRVLVMRGGAVMGELAKDELQQERILRLAMGKGDHVNV